MFCSVDVDCVGHIHALIRILIKARLRRFPAFPRSFLHFRDFGRAACRVFNARCVVWLGGWLQGAARSQWHLDWQASQRSRRRPAAQPEGPEGLLVLGKLDTPANAFKINSRAS
jgi:hypothetical protein